MRRERGRAAESHVRHAGTTTEAEHRRPPRGPAGQDPQHRQQDLPRRWVIAPCRHGQLATLRAARPATEPDRARLHPGEQTRGSPRRQRPGHADTRRPSQQRRQGPTSPKSPIAAALPSRTEHGRRTPDSPHRQRRRLPQGRLPRCAVPPGSADDRAVRDPPASASPRRRCRQLPNLLAPPARAEAGRGDHPPPVRGRNWAAGPPSCTCPSPPRSRPASMRPYPNSATASNASHRTWKRSPDLPGSTAGHVAAPSALNA